MRCYINYANIAWASANKSKLQVLYRQKHAVKIINFLEKFSSTTPPHEHIYAMAVCEMNIHTALYNCRNRNWILTLFYSFISISTFFILGKTTKNYQS